MKSNHDALKEFSKALREYRRSKLPFTKPTQARRQHLQNKFDEVVKRQLEDRAFPNEKGLFEAQNGYWHCCFRG